MKKESALKNLKCFTGNKKKIHLLCGCEDNIIKAISYILERFLDNKLVIKKRTRLRKKLYPVRKDIRKLVDRRVSIREKRKILVNRKVRDILHPVIKDTLVPILQKSLKKR